MVTGGAVGREGTTPEAEAKEAWGILAYARQGVETLEEGIPTYDLSLRLDDGEVLESRALNLILGNGRFTGGGLPVTPTAYLDDGLADLIVVPELDLSEMAVLTSLLLVGRHSDHESLKTRRVREVEMTSDPPLDLNLDGEPGRMAEARFEVVPGALRVVVGEEPDRAFEEPDAVEE
jgi:diacylglycerol kinase family enzyme